MASSKPSVSLADTTDYLVVDSFLESFVAARALKTAFELRLIPRLESGPASREQLARDLGLEPAAVTLLVDLLRAATVVDVRDETIELSSRFCDALRFRELLEMRLDYAGFVLPDFSERFSQLLARPDEFRRDSRLFRLFGGPPRGESAVDAERRTKRWMHVTTMLTRHEAPVCMQLHDFRRYEALLDIGGNSGEFAIQLCRRHPGLRATVMDLPRVCELGLEHVLAAPERERIRFTSGDARVDPIPTARDLVSFKSMLHDWPDAEAARLLERAVEALAPGGTLLIFERGPLAIGEAVPPFSQLPDLLFFRSYRPASFYREQLERLGLDQIEVQEIELDTPFFLVTAKK